MNSNSNYVPLSGNTSQSKGRTIAVIIILVACFIGAIVAVGGPLNETKFYGITIQFFATKIMVNGNSASYSSCNDNDDINILSCSKCLNGGRAVIGAGVITIITSLGGIILAILRVAGKTEKISFERGLAVMTFLGILSISGIWSGTCYESIGVGDKYFTGLGYIFACIIFIIIALILLNTGRSSQLAYQSQPGYYVLPQGQPVYNQYAPQGQPGYNQYAPPQGQPRYNQYVPPQGQPGYNQYAPPQGSPGYYPPPAQGAPGYVPPAQGAPAQVYAQRGLNPSAPPAQVNQREGYPSQSQTQQTTG